MQGVSNRSSLRLAIVTNTTPTETFIRAHIERLPFRVIHLSGYEAQYSQNGAPVKSLSRSGHPSFLIRVTRLLPEVISFRIRQRMIHQMTDQEILADYLSQESIDVVLAEYGMMGAFLAPVCAMARIPIVVHFHGADATRRDYLESFGSRYRSMFKSAAACIAVSNRMKRDLIAIGCDEEKVVLCPYGPNENFFNCQPDYFSNQLIAVGRLTPKKAPHLTILAFAEALRTNSDLRLVVIGDGELWGVCRDLVTSLSLSGKVELLGTQTPEQIQEHMNRSFAFVQHSVEAWDGDCEGTPVSVLEAAAAGLPVISTRHAGINDVIQQGETGLLGPERDIVTMTSSIVRYANDRSFARACGERAREFIRTHLPISRHLERLSQVIERASGRI